MQRLERRKLTSTELEETLRGSEVLEAVLAEIPELERGIEQVASRL